MHRRVCGLPTSCYYAVWQVANGSELGPGAGMRVAMESEDAEGQSAEEREAALNEAVTKRMDELEGLAAYAQRLL